MTEQGGALAELRTLIKEYAEAKHVHFVSQILNNGTSSIQKQIIEIKQGHIERELAAVEARIAERDEARRLLAAVTDAWLQLPFRRHVPQMKAPIAAAVEWLRTHPERS